MLERLSLLKIYKSPGPDETHPRVLSKVRVEIAEASVIIFQSSLDTGVVPEDWRIVNITPLFKKGCKDKSSNYRPVSLTSVVGKLLEIIARDKISVT